MSNSLQLNPDNLTIDAGIIITSIGIIIIDSINREYGKQLMEDKNNKIEKLESDKVKFSDKIKFYEKNLDDDLNSLIELFIQDYKYLIKDLDNQIETLKDEIKDEKNRLAKLDFLYLIGFILIIIGQVIIISDFIIQEFNTSKDLITILKQFGIYEAEALLLGGAIGTFIASTETITSTMENWRGITLGGVSSVIGIISLIELTDNES